MTVLTLQGRIEIDRPECKAETANPFLQLMNKIQSRINERDGLI
jgi:hypothetical protein